MIVYRLASGRYPKNDGSGASLYGGRWNQKKGTPVIDTAPSRALCALEVLANADELAGDYTITPIEVPDYLATTTLSKGRPRASPCPMPTHLERVPHLYKESVPTTGRRSPECLDI